MPKSWVLKFPRSDEEGQILLQASSSGDSALDINILATEGEAPYKGKIRQRKTTDLRAKNYHGSNDEWQDVLSYVFNPQSTASLPDDQLKSLEVVAAIGNGKVTLTLRKRIDKITQRLGSVELIQDDDVEIQLFEWCTSVIDHKFVLEAEQSELRSRCDSAQSTIRLLEAKLEELVKAKTDHEEQLMSKFLLLLNEKKLKIRDQQRLLSTAKVDKTKLQQMRNTLEGKGRQAESSRAGKRSADAQSEPDAEAQTDSSDAFEDMDLDKQEAIVARSQEASSERHTTPETETATESDGMASELATNSKKSVTTKASKKKNGRPSPKHRKSPQTRPKAASPLPPIRQLPFAKAGVKAQKGKEVEREPETKKAEQSTARSKANADDSGEETASDDDEL